jgi:excisionase family DNA binding protein
VTNTPANEKGALEMAPPRFFTISAVANFLDVSARSVRRWIATAALPIHRFGGAVRISESDLSAFIAKHRKSD